MKKNNKLVDGKSYTGPLKMNLQLFAEGEVQKPVQQPVQQPNNTDALLGAINQMQQQMQQQSQQLQSMATPQKTAEQVQAEREALIEEFNSSPDAVLNRFQKQAQDEAMKAVNPLINDLTEKLSNVTWKDAVRTFAGSNPNAKAYSQQMNEILKTNPMLAKMAKEDPMQALNLSLAQAMTQSLAPNGNIVEGISQNEELVNQILSNPDVKKRVIDEYVASLNGGTPVPPVAGNSTSAPTVAPTPTGKPANIKDAAQGALAYIQAMNQQSQ